MVLSHISNTLEVIGAHFGRVLFYNYNLSNQLNNASTFKKGIEGIASLAGTELENPLFRAKTLFEGYLPLQLLEPTYTDNIVLTHEWMLLAISPLAYYTFVPSAYNQIRNGCDSSLSTTMRVYNFAKAAFSVAMVCITTSSSFTRVSALIPKLRENPHLFETLQSVSRILGYISTVGFLLSIVASIMHVQQTYLIFESYRNSKFDEKTLDAGVVKECFGADSEKINKIERNDKNNSIVENHVDFYKKIKMVQMANTIVKSVAITALKFIPVTAPLVPIILLGTMVTGMATEFWLERRVKQLKIDLKIPSDSKETMIAKTASLVTLVASPFILGATLHVLQAR